MRRVFRVNVIMQANGNQPDAVNPTVGIFQYLPLCAFDVQLQNVNPAITIEKIANGDGVYVSVFVWLKSKPSVAAILSHG